MNVKNHIYPPYNHCLHGKIATDETFNRNHSLLNVLKCILHLCIILSNKVKGTGGGRGTQPLAFGGFLENESSTVNYSFFFFQETAPDLMPPPLYTSYEDYL